MKNLIPLFLLLWVSFACREKEEPVTPEEAISACNPPEDPVLYGELLDMPLRVVELDGLPKNYILRPTTETRDGLTFSEPYLVNTAINFSVCKIPEAYRKHGMILNISGKAYINSDFMVNAKISYENDPNMLYGTTRLVFLDDITITPVE